ncbi:hypothetical protein QYM36_001835, partial [Artemia franciscana]
MFCHVDPFLVSATVYPDDPVKDHLGLSVHLQPSQNINIQKMMCVMIGIVSKSFLKGIITLIAKKRKNTSDYTGLFGDNQFGFQKGIGCPEEHRSLANMLRDLESKKSPLYVCTVDLSKVLDSINHMQSLNALLQSCINMSIVKTIKFWST